MEIVLKIKGEKVTLSLGEAEKLYHDLSELFTSSEKSSRLPDFDYPETPKCKPARVKIKPYYPTTGKYSDISGCVEVR